MKHSCRSHGQRIQAFAMLSMTGMLGCTANVADESASVPEPVAQAEEAVISGAAVKQYLKYFRLPAGGYLDTVRSACPSGSVVVGGGYSGAPDSRVYFSGIDGNGWSVSAMNLSNSVSSILRVYAQCLSGTNATTGTASPATVVLSKAGGTGCAYAECPSGKLLTGGGYSAPTSFRASTNQVYTGGKWQVCGWNEHPTESITLFAYPVCMGGVTGEVTWSFSQGTVPAGTSKILTGNACSSGLLLGSGGYSTAAKKLYVQATGRSDMEATTWTNTFMNLTSSPQNGTVVGTCLNLWP